MKPNIDFFIDDLVNTAFGDKSVREQFLLRQTLHNLVRMAKTEQMLDIKASVHKLAGTSISSMHGRQARIDET